MTTLGYFDITAYTIKSISTGNINTTYLKPIFVSFISILIVITNIINLIVLYHMKQLPRVSRLFLLNLSFSDLLVGIVACAPSIYSAATDEWPYGAVWCQVAGIAHGTSVTISIWSISMVGIDRYIAVTKPFTYTHFKSSRKMYAVIAALWFAAIVTFAMPLFTKQNMIYYVFSPDTSMCGMHWEYKSFCVITGFYIPILSGSILSFTSFKITRKLQENSKNKMTKQSASRASMTRKTLHILLATAIIYFTCWTPYVMLVFVESFSTIRGSEWLHFATVWTANSNSMVNVFIYSATNPQYRKTLKLFICMRRRNQISGISSITEERSGTTMETNKVYTSEKF